MAYFEKRTESWRAQFQIDGVRKSKSGFSSKKSAESYEYQQRVQYERSALLGYPQNDDLKINELFEKYLKWAYENKKLKSAKRDDSSLTIWKRFFQNKKKSFVRQINKNMAIKFIEWRSEKRTCRGEFPSKRTINLDIMTLRHVLNWAVLMEKISLNPLENLKKILFRQDNADLPRYLTIEEIKILEEECQNKGLLLAIAVLLRTGMRSGELCGLEIDNVDFKRSRIILRPKDTKNRRMRIIPFNEIVTTILENLVKEAQQNNRTYLFYSGKGKQQTADNSNRRLRTLLNSLEQKGVMKNTKEISIHTLRKTYISHMIMKGTDPVKVMAIVGHQEWSTIKRYLVLSPDYIVDDANPPY